MDLNFDLYMNGVVEQARNEIESAGYEQLTTSDEVDKVFKQDGTTLVMINWLLYLLVKIKKQLSKQETILKDTHLQVLHLH